MSRPRPRAGSVPLALLASLFVAAPAAAQQPGAPSAKRNDFAGSGPWSIGASGKATRIAAGEVPVQGRATQGRRTITLDDGDRVVEVARVAQERDEGENGDTVATTDSEGEPSPSGDVKNARERSRHRPSR